MTLRLTSGELIHGHVFVVANGRLKDILNGQDRFTEFETQDGKMVYLHKDQIASCLPLDLQRTDQLLKKGRDLNAFDPFATLGIDKTAGPGEIRAAYWAKARLYHPDKVSGLEAPKEVLEYMTAQFTRISTAYEQLSGGAAS